MKSILNRQLTTTQGSITIEAALILPFVIGVFVLGFSFMYVSYCHAKIQNRLNELCVEFEYSSYLLHELRIVDRIQELYQQNQDQQISYEEAPQFIKEVSPILTSFNGGSSDGNSLNTEFSTIIQSVESFRNIMTFASELPSTIKCETLYFLMREWGENFFGPRLQSYCNEENISTNISIDHCELFLEDDTGSISISYSIKLPFSFGIFKSIKMCNSAYIHTFAGAERLIEESIVDLDESTYGEEDSYIDEENIDELENQDEQNDDEKDNNAIKVYVTDAGIRYHIDPYCFHINVIATPMILGENPGKSPCDICSKTIETKLYMVVYSTENSSVYHVENRCRTIYHKLHTLSEKEAIVKGYTPCLTCSKSVELYRR